MNNQENIAPIDKYVIDFVRDLRTEKQLTQDDIANIIELSRSFVKNIESINSRAKYNIRHINALADYFNMSPREFFPEKAFPVSIAKDRKMANPVKKAASKKVLSKKAGRK